KGDLLREKLAPLYEHPYVGDIRGKGLLVGIELVKDRKTKEPVDVSVVNSIIKKCREAGLIIGKNGDTVAGFNNILTISPPLIITEQEVEFIAETLINAVAQIEEAS